jgi:hypothetical protein
VRCCAAKISNFNNISNFLQQHDPTHTSEPVPPWLFIFSLFSSPTMTKSSSASRQKGAPKATSGNSKATAKSSVTNSKKQSPKRIGQSVAKGKKDFQPPIQLLLSLTWRLPTPPPLQSPLLTTMASRSSPPLSASLSPKFSAFFPKSEKADIQGHGMKDLAFENEDDKAIDQHLKRGTKLINVTAPTPLDWYELFSQAFDPRFDYEAGADMRDLSLNLAASDPLDIFPPEAIDRLGNLYEGHLSSAWTAATACLGSVHLFFDKELLSNKIAAAAYDSGIEDDAQHFVPISGQPSHAYLNLAAAEKEESQCHTYPERLGDNPEGRFLQDSINSFSKHFKTPAQKMSIAKWRHYFGDASSKGTLIAASGCGRQLRAFGSNLALSSPRDLFMAHEWFRRPTCVPRCILWLGLRPWKFLALSGSIAMRWSTRSSRR